MKVDKTITYKSYLKKQSAFTYERILTFCKTVNYYVSEDHIIKPVNYYIREQYERNVRH